MGKIGRVRARARSGEKDDMTGAGERSRLLCDEQELSHHPESTALQKTYVARVSSGI